VKIVDNPSWTHTKSTETCEFYVQLESGDTQEDLPLYIQEIEAKEGIVGYDSKDLDEVEPELHRVFYFWDKNGFI
jgi:hypothetical protein